MASNNFLFGYDGRLRSGWRFLAFAAAFIPVSAVLSGVAYTFAAGTAPNARPTIVFLVANSIFLLSAALGVGFVCGRIFEQLPFSSLGASLSKHWLQKFLVGMLIGIATFAAAAGVGIAAGGLRFTFNQALAADIIWTLVVSFAIFAVAAAFEEALFRGYILQTFVRSDLTIFGLVLTSLLFATVHNGNPAASPISWANTCLAGIWFTVAYLRTRDLWLPFGLHLAWNWAQGSIFGVEVSGLTDFAKNPLMREIDLGPDWLTGGNYGIEGGVVTAGAILLSTIAIYFAPRNIFERGTAITADGSVPRSIGS